MKVIKRLDNLPKGSVFLDIKNEGVLFCENERANGFAKNSKIISSEENSFDYDMFKMCTSDCECHLGLKPEDIPTEDTLEDYVKRLKSNGKYLKIK